jgi:CBS domain containing-hemolysin-like protein
MEEHSKHSHYGIILVPLLATVVGFLLLLILGLIFGTPSPEAFVEPEPQKVELAAQPALEYLAGLFRLS